MTSYISPSITDPALRDTLQSIADDVDASGITISDVDPDASLTARSGRLWYNATSSNLFIFSDAQGGYVRATGEEQSYHAVRIYWPNSASVYPASPPQVTLTWANLTAASAGAQYTGGLTLPTVSGTAWQEDPPKTLSTGQTHIWWSDVIFQRIGGPNTTVSTGTTPQKHTNFNGVVTFNSLSTSNPGSTIINGDNITTGSINFNRITGVSISASAITAGIINAARINADSLSVDTILGGHISGNQLVTMVAQSGSTVAPQNGQAYIGGAPPLSLTIPAAASASSKSGLSGSTCKVVYTIYINAITGLHGAIPSGSVSVSIGGSSSVSGPTGLMNVTTQNNNPTSYLNGFYLHKIFTAGPGSLTLTPSSSHGVAQISSHSAISFFNSS